MASRLYTAKDLYHAIRNEQWDEVRRIIRAQPLLVNEKFEGDTLFYYIAVCIAPSDVVAESLKSATAEAVDYAPQGDCILHRIARLGYAQEMRKALAISGRNVNLKDTWQETALHKLLKGNHQFSDHLDIAKFLLDAGADVNIQNKFFNQTPEDLYRKNECKKYNFRNRRQQKNEVLQLLQDVPEVILARGSEALKVFKKELEDGQITVNHARLMVTGKHGVGKTCLVNTLLEKEFNEKEPSTDGIVLTTAFQTTDTGFSECKQNENMKECERVKQIFDIALAAKVSEKLQQKSNQAEAAEPAPLVHAPKKLHVVVRAYRWLTNKEGRRKAGTSSTPVLPVVPVPVETEVNDPRKALPLEWQWQKRVSDIIKGKTCASTGNEDMTYIWDFAGQQLYYITHRIFLTSEAVYLIVFNLLEDMHNQRECRVFKMTGVMTYNMTNIQIIKYWMRLIFTYAVPFGSQSQAQLQEKKPQILVVGTHSESLPGTAEDKKMKIKEQFGIIFEEIRGTPYECHVVRKMYAIDNKLPEQSKMLTTLIKDIGGFLKAMPKPIPLKWLEFQRILQENGRIAVRMSYSKVCEVATSCGISVKNLIHTLNYLHDLGIILYFENNKLLKDTVITNPRKLIDIFKKIITVVEPDDTDMLAAMMQMWNKLDNEGILEEQLARHLWRDEIDKNESSFGVFIELMKQFGLVCEQIKNQASNYRSFFVPCRLKRSKANVSIELDKAHMVSIYMASEDFIPDSVFHPLVVSLIGMVQDMGYTAILELFSNYANIRLGLEHTLSLGPVDISNKPSLKLEILRMPITQVDGTETIIGEPSPRVCMQVLEFLKKEMKVLTSGMKHAGYKFCVLCWTSLQEMHFHDLEECLENAYIPCERKLITTDKLQRMFKNKQLVKDSSKEAPTPIDIKTAIPDKNLGYLESEHLLQIAKGLGLVWRQVGVRLDFSWSRIQQIYIDYKLSQDCIMGMLTEWRKKQNYETNQVEIMYRVLTEQGLTELADKVFGSQVMSVDSSFPVEAVEDHASGRWHRTHIEQYGQLKDIDMLFLATKLGKHWKAFGITLGLEQHDIEEIMMDFQPAVDSSTAMLIKWRERQNANVNHLEKIREALNKLDLKSIGEELDIYYREKYQ